MALIVASREDAHQGLIMHNVKAVSLMLCLVTPHDKVQ